MNATLKLLLLNCIVLLVIAFSIVFALRYDSPSGKGSRIFSHTVSRETSLHRNASTTTEGGDAVASFKNPIEVIDLESNASYISFSASSSNIVDFDVLTPVGGDYYMSSTTAYYHERDVQDCDNPSRDVLVQLPVTDIASFSVDASGAFAKDTHNVFVEFYTLNTVDTSSFVLLGKMKALQVVLDDRQYFWYKDATKIFTLLKITTFCDGRAIFESTTNGAFLNADVATFEYIGNVEEKELMGYAKDKNFYYGPQGVLSSSITPSTCTGDFFAQCLPRINGASSTVQ